MSGIQAISFNELQCGRKISETKKRFQWKFKVNGKQHFMELANSTLSGKKVVTLDSMELYSQKSLLNIDFDFMHNIDGHTFRISRVADNINKFQMRIDNRSFQDILNKICWGEQKQEKQSSNSYKKAQNDPFSEFGNFVSNAPTNSKSNQFGDFDFDSFNKQVSKPSNSNILQSKTQNSSIIQIQPNFIKPNPKNYQTINFQTNSFQTNSFGDFMANFNKVQQNLLDQNEFSTNNFNKNNLYNDLLNQKPQLKSENYNEQQLQKIKLQEQQKKKKKQNSILSFLPNFDDFKIEMSGKQVMNAMKKKTQQLKNQFNGINDSLI